MKSTTHSTQLLTVRPTDRPTDDIVSARSTSGRLRPLPVRSSVRPRTCHPSVRTSHPTASARSANRPSVRPSSVRPSSPPIPSVRSFVRPSVCARSPSLRPSPPDPYVRPCVSASVHPSPPPQSVRLAVRTNMCMYKYVCIYIYPPTPFRG